MDILEEDFVYKLFGLTAVGRLKTAGLENDSRTEVEGCYFRPSLWQPIVFCKQNLAVTHKALGVGSIQGDLFGRNFN